MNAAGKPCYRRGKALQGQILHCLQVMNLRREGQPLEGEVLALAKQLEQTLTPLQETYLQLYYGERLTLERIAQRLGRNISSVSRGMNRAEVNVEKVVGAGGS